jgi:CubicO group peptidase (beta-lactamase class C family)
VLAVETAGFADIAASKPIAADAVFWIASQSKAMTAAAVMMLVDEGKVKLDDPVEKYLPEFKGQMVATEKDDQHVLLKKPVHPITVRNVLSHTSGLPFSTAVENPTLDMLPLRVAVRSYAMSPLQFEPDSKYQYSNAGINTAARVLEVVSGIPYEEFMQKRLFEPLGMKDTTFHPSAAQVARMAKGYKPNAAKDGLEEAPIGQLHYPLDDAARQPMPAGGLFSTAADVVLFCQMLMNGGEVKGHHILSEAAVKEMTSRQTAKDLKESYGFGLSISPDGFGHGGAYATNMNVSLKRGIITVWLIQHAGFPGEGGKAQGAFNKAAEKFGK